MGAGNNSENAFTPKVSLQWQADPHDMYYATYAKGFRPGGANNPLPQAACAADFKTFGISESPTEYSSDSVNSYELGAKNNIDNVVRLATSLYYIRWNNIQQTVIPPICQISFIANLGQAVAKGVDLQLDASLTDSLTAQLAAGFTDARYTKDSRLSPSEVNPIVANGDAIVGQSSETGGGQPTAPITVSLGLEYTFTMFQHRSFVRADSEYEARARWQTAAQDPNTLQYDPANYTLPGTIFTSLRAGLDIGAWSVSAFVDNLTNSHAVTDYDWTICPAPTLCQPSAGARLEREFTFRPRTIGVTAIFITEGEWGCEVQYSAGGVLPAAASALTTSRRVASTLASGVWRALATSAAVKGTAVGVLGAGYSLASQLSTAASSASASAEFAAPGTRST
jgi:iron complex outermembrane recepter protein